MRTPKLPPNSFQLTLEVLNDEDVNIKMAHSFGEDQDDLDEVGDFYTSVLFGLQYYLAHNAEMLARMGDLLVYTKMLEDEAEGIAFEPDDALKEAIADKKVVDIKSRMN